MSEIKGDWEDLKQQLFKNNSELEKAFNNMQKLRNSVYDTEEAFKMILTITQSSFDDKEEKLDKIEIIAIEGLLKKKNENEKLKDIQSYIRGAKNGLENKEDDVSIEHIVNLLRDSHKWLEDIIKDG